MAVMVKYVRDTDYGKLFKDSKGQSFYAKSYEDGYVELDVFFGTFLEDFAEFVEGCFAKNSNFKSEMKAIFGKARNSKFFGIKFNCNGIELHITEEFADKDKIIQLYEAGVRNLIEQERKARELAKEELRKTPEYKAYEAKKLKGLYRFEKVRQELQEIAETTEIEFKSDEFKKMFEEIAEINSDSYGKLCIEFTERFAKFAQHLMAKHNKSLADIVDNVTILATVAGMNGLLYAHSMATLELCWKHADQLVEWKNKMIEKTMINQPEVCLCICLDDEEDDESAE